MLTTEPTPELIAQWKRIAEEFRGKLAPNRKSGAEVVRYFRKRYAFPETRDSEFAEIAAGNLLDNPANAEKLPAGAKPDIRTYQKDGILVGIDRVTGFFHIECEDIERVIPIYDDLFVYRGLDSADLENFFLTAEYVRLAGLKCN